MVPDGDRRQATQSRRVVNEIILVVELHDDVVCVFVLHDDVDDRAQRARGQTSAHHVFERLLPGNKDLCALDDRGGDSTARDAWGEQPAYFTQSSLSCQSFS